MTRGNLGISPLELTKIESQLWIPERRSNAVAYKAKKTVLLSKPDYRYSHSSAAKDFIGESEILIVP